MSDRIAVMNVGRVEQVGSPREIYERPRTPFVADFIGSLNALDLRADELVGTFAMMRVGEGERLVAPVESGVKAGDSIRIAVRPEQVQIALPHEADPNGGSRLTGTVAEVVYLGMYTQFHVETPVGRVVAHRMADEDLPPFEAGARVAVSWDPENASVLGLGLERDAALERAPSDLGENDHGE